MSNSTLSETLARLDAGHDYCRFVAGRPAGADAEEWTSVRRLLDDATVLEGWFAEGLGVYRDQADVAGSFLAGWLADVLLQGVAWSLAEDRRTWALDPDVMWVHRDPGGWFDGLAVAASTMRVLADDPRAGADDVEIRGDADELRHELACDAVAVLTPLFAAVRSLAPFGLRGMWGAAADGLGSGAAYAAFRGGADPAAAFDAAMRLVDDVASAGAGRMTRPTTHEVRYVGGDTVYVRKGTCCLWYKAAAEDVADTDRYCTSCPLRDADDQRSRYARWLDSLVAPSTPTH